MRVYLYMAALVMMMLLCAISEASAQYHRERHYVRKGNEQFSRANYRTSLNLYNTALEYDSTSYEALYNRANAHHQLRHSNPEDSTLMAETTYRYYEGIAADELLSDVQRAEVLRNLGESLFTDREYKAALNAFRESLLLNPEDDETKYNYVLTKRIVDQQRNQQQQNNDGGDGSNQNQDNQDQSDDQQDQNPNGDQQDQPNEGGDDQQDSPNGEDPSDDSSDQGDQDGGDQPQDDDQSQGGDEPQQQGLNPDQERMLSAIQAEEDKTQEKLQDGEKAIVIPGKKNW